MSKPTSRHRTRQQWQALIDQWNRSDQSAKQFCREQGLGYASFCQWRKRLSPTRTVEPATEDNSTASFLDLASLGSLNTGRWNIVLSLGNGVELKLSQA